MKILPSIAIAVSAIILNVNVSEAVTISATASGSNTPPQLPVIDSPVTIINGDFTITDSPGFTEIAGDGIDEITIWSFDFSSNSNLDLFSPSTELSSALLTLTLTPSDSFITTDTTGIHDGEVVLESVAVPSLPDIPPVGQTDTITFDLLDFGFSQTTILNVLNADASKTIPWRYQDDAIISFAQLDLTVETVPEPVSILGTTVALGLGAIFARKKQKR